MSHYLTAIVRHQQQNRVGAQGAIVPATRPAAPLQRPQAPRPPAQRLRAEGESDCSCTGTAIGAGLLGAIVGLIGGWMLSDAKKAELKSKARARAASAAERAAARIRG